VNGISIKGDELAVWSRFIHELCGVHLDTSKGYLLETRLGTIVRDAGVGSFSELYHKVRSDVTHTLRRKIVDAITTNETSFFRDTAPFDLLRHKLVPDLIDRRSKAGLGRIPIRIWSAACSTGQEIYSVAMTLKETLVDFNRYDIRLYGTDISDRAVAAASYAKYSQLELDRGLGMDKLGRYFVREGDKWKVKDELRALATFKTANLLEPLMFPHPFDIVFCRNVAIYFTEPDKLKLFRNIGRLMARDGSLIIGSTESITGLCPEFEPKRHLRSVFYQFKGAPG